MPKWATTFETGNVVSTISLSESKPEIAVKVQNEEVRIVTENGSFLAINAKVCQQGMPTHVYENENPTLPIIFHLQVSWEPYYAALVGAGGAKNAADMAVRLDGASGNMAPRGKEGERIRTERDDPT